MSLIVILDDRVSNRNIFAKLAASIEEDVMVHTFGDPEEALTWLATQSPDLVITDYKMPQMDGAEFIRRFRELPSSVDVPVIVITVYEERSFRLRALEAGATDFLHSPVDHHEFITRARNLLKLQKQQMLLASRATQLQRELEHSKRSRKHALCDSRDALVQIIDTLPVAISAAGPDGCLLFANNPKAELLGIAAHKMVGQSLEALFGEEAGGRMLALNRMVFETAKALPPFEESMVDRHGEARVFLTTKSPLKDHMGKVIAVLTSSLEMTMVKNTQAHMHHLVHHDPLTGLTNPTLLHEPMRGLIASTRWGEQSCAPYLLDHELRRAIANEEFLLYYQPQVDMRSGQIVGAEALLRWNRVGNGMIGPGVFLKRCEENGLIIPLNEWVLREACREARSWHEMGLEGLRVSVNLSPLQFRKRQVRRLVTNVLRETKLDAHCLELELSESIVLCDFDNVSADLRQLLDLGVHVSIDDFGTGGSSLSYVNKFPLDRLKIDQRFVRNLTSDPGDAAIVGAILKLGHSLNLQVVAKGVETAGQFARLREDGCDEVQGNYFGRPMPARDFLALVMKVPPLAASA